MRHIAVEGGLLKLRLGLDHPRLRGVQVSLRHLEIVQTLIEGLLGNELVAQQILAALEISLGAGQIGLRGLQIGLRALQAGGGGFDRRNRSFHIRLRRDQRGLLRIDVGGGLHRLRLQEQLPFLDRLAFCDINVRDLAEEKYQLKDNNVYKLTS